MTTDTSERGLEDLIVRAMTGHVDLLSPKHVATETSVPVAGGSGWLLGDPHHYDRDYCVELVQLRGFLMATQEDVLDELSLDVDGATRRKFLARLQGEISKRGTIDVLRHGIKHGPLEIDLFYGTPSPDNKHAQELFARNRFSVTRQLRYSNDETQNSLDICLFVNGLPIATFELKNSLTKQTVADAIEQYKRDRSPREKLFEKGRCAAHFAVDDAEVWFCTNLTGGSSWFLPFNMGWNHGAGNPPNTDGLKTDYLWKQILTPRGLTDILENYAQLLTFKDESGKKQTVQIWPRYHQLDVVRRLLADAAENGVGRKYLIQHSAGSGKSNSIAWLVHQLIGLEHEDEEAFDSIIVVTDRTILDSQIRDTIKQFAQVSSTIGAVTDGSKQLREFIEGGKKIIISTLQKFPFILDDLGSPHRDRNFAIVIDEAHSSQGGKAAAALNQAFADDGESEDDETLEDAINKLMESKKMLSNASYFAFTATPKNKTLELFGQPFTEEGVTKHRPFDVYSMKQAIQEGFILDVVANYTTVDSYYRLVKTVEGDPEFDAKRARKKLRKYVEGHEHAIRVKAEIIVDHFLEQVIDRRKIGGEARAMVVCSSIERALDYYHAIRAYLVERKSPHHAIVAFSGEPEYKGSKVTEASLNKFPSSKIADRIGEDPYRFLVCADKFQTGYDEPLLHTMYVDKPLAGVKAVQTLSRLNRAHPKKHDVFVLDFMNDPDTIERAFAPYYRATILSEETNPDKLHDLKADLDGHEVYSAEDVEQLVELYLSGADRDQLDIILDACVATYLEELGEDEQVDFKSKAKTFVRTYGFLAAILPYTNANWEKLSIFLNFLTPKLPAPKEDDLSRGVLETIDMDSYRAEKSAAMKIQLPDKDGGIPGVPTSSGGSRPEPEIDLLSNILKTFNEMFGTIQWTDADRVQRLIAEEIPSKVAADEAYQNAQAHSDKQNARIEHDAALNRVMTSLIKDDTELFKQFSDNESFQKWLRDTVFALTYRPPEADAA